MEWLHDLLTYDPVTGNLYWKARPGNTAFNARQAGKVAGYISHGYVAVNIQKKQYSAHRIAWFLVYGEIPSEIDHKDRDKSNNKINNLRISTRSQNCANRKTFCRQSVGVKGVAFETKKRLYRARIQVNGKRINLGRFKSIDDAQKAYQKAAEKYFGDFACH